MLPYNAVASCWSHVLTNYCIFRLAIRLTPSRLRRWTLANVNGARIFVKRFRATNSPDPDQQPTGFGQSKPSFLACPLTNSNVAPRPRLTGLEILQTAQLAPHSTNAPAPVSWHSQNQVGIQDISYLGSSRAASSRSRSSVVDDGGDAKQLAHTATTRRTRSFSDLQRPTESTDEALSLNFSHLGSLPSDVPRHPETLDSDLASEEEGHSQDHGHDGNTDSPLTANDNLELDLRAAFQDSEEQEKRRFLPLDQLDKIVTADRVKRELQKHNIVPPGKLDDYTGQIWGITKSPNPTSRRKIFAILVLLQKVAPILDFIEHGLYDKDLPFILTEGSRPGCFQLSRKRKGSATEPIPFCQDPNAWPTYLLECFETYQWQLLAPYFELSTKSKPKVLHYNLERNRILPLIEVDKENASAHCGGFGDVWRVKIHPAHHNCYAPSVCTASTALVWSSCDCRLASNTMPRATTPVIHPTQSSDYGTTTRLPSRLKFQR